MDQILLIQGVVSGHRFIAAPFPMIVNVTDVGGHRVRNLEVAAPQSWGVGAVTELPAGRHIASKFKSSFIVTYTVTHSTMHNEFSGASLLNKSNKQMNKIKMNPTIEQRRI